MLGHDKGRQNKDQDQQKLICVQTVCKGYQQATKVYMNSDLLLLLIYLIVTPIVGFCNCSMFCCALLYDHSSYAALLNLSSWCLVLVVWPFLTVPCVCLQFIIVLFPVHTHLLFL